MTLREIVKRLAYCGPATYARWFWSEERRNQLLAKWQLPQTRSSLEQVFFKPVFESWIRESYLTESDPDRRETLKSICMGGDSGEAWAAEYDSLPIDRVARLHDLSFDEACPWYPAMDAHLSSAAAGTLVVQVGASSGREIAYFAKRAPELRFLGTDIDEKIVKRAATSHRLPNLDFAVGLAHQLVGLMPRAGDVILYSNGSLQYVQPEHLALMFERIRSRGNIEVLLGEPWRADGERFRGNGRSRYRGNFSYSHDYADYAEAGGLQILEQEKVRVAVNSQSPHYFTRHFFLRARA